MALLVARRLCVGNMAVPLEECKKDLADPKAVGIGSHDDIKLLSLNLTGTRNSRQHLWLAEALGLGVGSLRKTLWKLPLIVAIRSETACKKPRGPQSAVDRNPHVAIGMRVRGRILLVENSTKVLRLFFRPGEEEDGIKWLLNELVADVQGLKDQNLNELKGLKDQQDEPEAGSQPHDPHSDEPEVGSEPDSHDAISESLDKALNELKNLPGCASATWLSSKSSFRVTASRAEGEKPKFMQKAVKGFKRKGGVECPTPTDEDLITAIEATKDALKPYLM